MSISVKEFTRLKEAVEAKQKEAERAAGAFEESLKRLKTDFECGTIEEAKAKLVELQARETATAEAFEKKLKEFQSEYAHVFDE